MKVFYTLQGVDFEWESDKALINRHKHETSFETACEVFFDPLLCPDDPQIVDGEVRERVIGMTKNWQLLYVVYTIRNDRIRVISVRPADRRHKKNYETQ
jgi:uncharacterized DUF497 family protein